MGMSEGPKAGEWDPAMTLRVERDPTGLLKQILLRTLLCHNQESYCQPGGKGRSLVALHTGHPPSVKRMTHVRKG